MKIKKHILIAYPIILVTVLLDQITKVLFEGKQFSLIDGVLSIYYNPHLNTGAAWNIFSGRVTMLVVLSLVFIVSLVFITYKFKEKNALYSVSYALIIGGAIGNLIDRIFLQGVRDFIKFDFVSFPIFNLADTFLIVGVILFCVFVLFFTPQSKEPEKKDLN